MKADRYKNAKSLSKALRDIGYKTRTIDILTALAACDMTLKKYGGYEFGVAEFSVTPIADPRKAEVDSLQAQVDSLTEELTIARASKEDIFGALSGKVAELEGRLANIGLISHDVYISDIPLGILCLCAGIGGIELGLSLVANVEPVCFVESDPYCQRVLKARYPNAFLWDDVTTFPAKEWGFCDIVTAGFPCQSWSLAGSRKGQEDERWLWPRIAEIIRVVGPRYVWLENVCGLLVGGLGPVLGDLAALGFDAEWGVFSCAGMGAPQRRERVFILAYRNGESWGREDLRGQGGRNSINETGRRNRAMANPDSADLREQPVTLAGGSGAAELGRVGEDVGKPDCEGPGRKLEHPESLQRGQGREAAGERPGRPLRADEALAYPDQQRLEERPGPGRDGTKELAPPCRRWP